MPSVNIKTKISFEELLHAVLQLDTSHFNKFIEQAQQLRNQQMDIPSSTEEEQLIKQINKNLTEEELRKLQLLQNKSRATLTQEEIADMESLIKRSESLHFQRIMALGQLAQLRNQSIDAVTKELGFQPFGG